MIEEIAKKAELKIDKTTWKLTKLGELAQDISSRVDNPAQSEYDRFVGLEHFVSGDLKIKSWGATENLTSSAKAFKTGDILFARRNAYLRRASMVEFDGCCSGDAFVLRENHEKIVPGFLAFIVNSNGLWDYANSNAAGTMSQRVKWRDLANYEFLLPPKEEQAKLAELLRAIQEVVEASSHALQKNQRLYLTEREFSILKQGDGSKLIYNSKLMEVVNDSIKFHPLRECLLDIRYGTSKKGNNNGIGVAVLGIPNVVHERLSLDSLNYVELENKELETCVLKKGDIVIVRTNGNPEYTGKSALYNIDENHGFASYLIKITVNQEILNPEFLVRFLQTKTARSYFKRHATSTAGNYNINTEVIKGISVPILSMKRQNKIVDRLKFLESTIDQLSEYSAISLNLQKSLINQVF